MSLSLPLPLPLLIPRCCDDWRSGVCGNAASCPVRLARERSYLYAGVRAKPALDYKTRKALLSHWSPRVAKAICRAVYPDFKGTYEQHLWLLTLKAAEGPPAVPGYTSYANEAREKGVLFLWPYKRIEDTRLCGPSHYLYYILSLPQPQRSAILAGTACRHSTRLNAKYLAEALHLNTVYMDLVDAVIPGDKGRKLRRRALNNVIKKQLMLTVDNQTEFKVIAYGWTHLRK